MFYWQTDYSDFCIWQTLSYIEQSEPVTLRKITNVCIVNDQIWTLKQKLEFRKTWISYQELNSFSVLMWLVMILTNVISKDCIRQWVTIWMIHIAEWTKCFPNGHCLVLENHPWDKHLLIVKDGPMDFTVIEHKSWLRWLNSTLQPTFKNLPLSVGLVSTKISIIFWKKAIKIVLAFPLPFSVRQNFLLIFQPK